ncbi:unnamed protein product [Moneuplotes crassus]|uniref:Uncharacterized protein n=1 Tax=Euplotes crassus TaxID=5936 RepID=A0AAD1XPX3_EUPCR|nr:unnamed protein product [Moneuplotes crassus]
MDQECLDKLRLKELQLFHEEQRLDHIFDEVVKIHPSVRNPKAFALMGESAIKMESKDLSKIRNNISFGPFVKSIITHYLYSKKKKCSENILNLIKPRQVEYLWINCGYEDIDSCYHKNILRLSKLAPMVTTRCHFSDIIISKNNFEKIIMRCRYTSIIIFCFCKIYSKRMKLKADISFKTTFVHFDQCEGASQSDWENNPSHLQSIIKAFSTSQIRNSLEKIHLGRLMLSITNLKNLFSPYPLPQTEITLFSTTDQKFATLKLPSKPPSIPQKCLIQ